MTVGPILALTVLLAGADKPAGPLAQLARGHAAYQKGDYAEAARLLTDLAPRLPRVKDYVLYYAGESELHAGRPARARPLFVALEKMKSSRLAEVAGFRVADCLWEEGARGEAVTRYRRLLGANAEGQRPSDRPSRTRTNSLIAGGVVLTDEAVGRFRVALALEEAAGRARGAPAGAARQRAAQAFRALHREFPAHPLAEQAGRKANLLEPVAPGAPASPAGSQADPPVRDRLVRAENLAEQRHLEAAVAELEKLQKVEMAPELVAEREYLLGMTLFKMRQDYTRASQVLLRVVDALPPEKAASAAFHGTRALSRVHRDDEAVVGYRKLVARFPGNRYAPEAQFLAGRLELNRGRLKEAKAGFEETVRRFPRSSFAEEAAWLVALSNVLLGEGEEALGTLERYRRMAGRGETDSSEAARRAQYFRARALRVLKREDEARAAFQELVRKTPFSYYGVMAAAQLRGSGVAAPVELPAWSGTLGPALPPGRAAADPLLARVEDLRSAGLTTDAGLELVRGEAGVVSRYGRERALALLFDRYPRTMQWRRAFQLAETHGDGALASAPVGSARVFWEAAYPRAFPELVEKYAAPAGNPEFFLDSIMRKESAFLPTEVSYADARGLVQLIPTTGARLAAELELPFSPDQLFVPETSIRLGARYLGGIARKFRGNIALAAGAYNAGAGPMMRWCDQHGKRPLDEFVELVTYDQSREYLKRVVAYQSRYHYLYKGKPLELGLTVDGCRYLPTGPDY